MAVRTQVYLPEALHRRLKHRGRLLNKSMAEQVREALERYLETEEPIEPMPDDPIWSIVGAAEGPPGGPNDASVRHDHYLYGWDKTVKPRPSRKNAGTRGRRRRSR